MTISIPEVPAPWALTGNGVILVYRFPKEFVQESGFVPPELRDSFAGGIGTVMIVNYATSNVGGYGELLFIPGQFRLNGKNRFSITKIYVSTQVSVENGWRNWAIPKEKADFAFQTDANGVETIGVANGGYHFFEMQIKPRGPRIPVNTAWLPVRPALAQPQDKGLMITAPTGAGRIQLAHVGRLRVDGALFPDISRLKPLLALKASDFRITFPVAATEPMNGER